MNQVKWILGGAKKNYDKIITNQTKLSDLNMDCMLIILEQLDFMDLLSLAQVDKYFSMLAQTVFRRKFANDTIVLYNFVSEDQHNKNGIISNALNRLGIVEKEKVYHATLHYDGNLQITDFEACLKTLEYFGNSIQKLKLYSDNTDTKQSVIISKFIYKYCSDTLIEFELDIIKGSAPFFFPKPLKRLEHITIGNYLPRIGRKTPPMNHTFPAIRKLTLNFHNKGSSYLNCYFPHLEHLNIEFVRSLDDITNMLSLNPHIQSISYHQKSLQSLKKISEILPDLKSLTLGSFNSNYDEIYFANVTKFSMKENFYEFGSPKNLHFPKLQEASIFINVFSENWINFFKEHNQLERIVLNYCNLNDAQFEHLTPFFQNAVDISINRRAEDFITTNTIIAFVQNHKHLMKISLDLFTENDVKILQERLGNNWEFKSLLQKILLTRKVQRTKHMF